MIFLIQPKKVDNRDCGMTGSLDFPLDQYPENALEHLANHRAGKKRRGNKNHSRLQSLTEGFFLEITNLRQGESKATLATVVETPLVVVERYVSQR